jgi:FkbM family methyltransferase
MEQVFVLYLRDLRVESKSKADRCWRRHGMSTIPDKDYAVSTINFEGHQYAICLEKNASKKHDPVTHAYRNDDLRQLAPLISIATAFLRPGERVFDLGAHLGGFALLAAKLGCQVVAVEASPRNSALLEKSVEQNQFSNLQLIHAAVGEHAGVVEFSSLGPFGHVATPETGLPSSSVPALRIDDLVAENSWQDVRLIKLDVEGSEIAAIHGMRGLLEKQAPCIYLESNKTTLAWYGHSSEDLKAELVNLGYKLYRVLGEQLIPVQQGELQVESVTDYFAARELPAELQNRVGVETVGQKASRSLRTRLREIYTRFRQ